jgi:transposase
MTCLNARPTSSPRSNAPAACCGARTSSRKRCGDLSPAEAAGLLDRWTSWAQRCRIPAFVKLNRTIRDARDGILATIRLGITNARVEGLNNRVRLITRRGFGFHSATAVAALVMLSCGPIKLTLPHER